MDDVLRCHCPPLLDGPECQQTRRSFGGRGYAWFPPLRPCFHSHLSLEFLADSPDGLLLYNGPLGLGQSHEPEDFLALGKCPPTVAVFWSCVLLKDL